MGPLASYVLLGGPPGGPPGCDVCPWHSMGSLVGPRWWQSVSSTCIASDSSAAEEVAVLGCLEIVLQVMVSYDWDDGLVHSSVELLASLAQCHLIWFGSIQKQ